LVSHTSSKYIIPKTSLPKIIPEAKDIKIRGIFTFLKRSEKNIIKIKIKEITKSTYPPD